MPPDRTARRTTAACRRCRSNFLPQLPFDNGMMKGGRDENLGAWPRTEAMVRDQLAEYYGMVTHLDEQIGRILGSARDESGHAENTLVVFAADNGLALGSHGLLGKQSVFEHSMRTPLIIGGPGCAERDRASQAFTYLFDLFPTIVRAWPASRAPAGVAGESLRAAVEGDEVDGPRDSVFLPFLATAARRARRAMEAHRLSEGRLPAVLRPRGRPARDHEPRRSARARRRRSHACRR